MSSKFPYPHISPASGIRCGTLLAAIFEALAETTMELVLTAVVVVAPFVWTALIHVAFSVAFSWTALCSGIIFVAFSWTPLCTGLFVA